MNGETAHVAPSVPLSIGALMSLLKERRRMTTTQCKIWKAAYERALARGFSLEKAAAYADAQLSFVAAS